LWTIQFTDVLSGNMAMEHAVSASDSVFLLFLLFPSLLFGAFLFYFARSISRETPFWPLLQTKGGTTKAGMISGPEEIAR
jgi:hypothetical protein